MSRRLANRSPWAYAGLALAVAAPLLGTRLVLAVDLALTPHPHLPTSYWGLPEATHVGPPSRLALDALFVFFGKLHAVAFGEQALLLAIVFLAGLGMHRAVPARSDAARFFAGALYAVNPFVYDRLYTGQWFLLLGYALVPWAWRAFVRLLRGSLRDAPLFAALLAGTGIASAHVFVLLLVLVVLATATTAWAERSRAVAGRAAAGTGLGLLASLYWLLPAPGVRELWSSVGETQLDYYRTVSAGHWGVGLTVLGLGGYWNDLTAPSHDVPWWPVVALVLVLLTIGGLVLRRHDPLALGVAGAGLVGFLLAIGDASGSTRGAFEWLLRSVAPARSFRESEKGVALVVFAYAFLGAVAVEWVLARARARGRRLAAAAAVIAISVPLLLGFRVLGGLWGRLDTAQFPPGWSSARAVLDREGTQSRTLFIPWSGYLALSFAHYRLVANPAAQFFSTPILASSSVGQRVNETSDPVEARVSSLLANAPTIPNLAGCLAHLGVGHVLLAHENGSLGLDVTLRARSDFVLEQSWPGIDLYRTTSPAGLLAVAPAATPCGAVLPVKVKRLSPVHYRLEQRLPAGRRVLIGLPDASRWKLAGDDLTYTPWTAYRRNYAVGAIALLAAITTSVLLIRRKR